MLSPAYAMRRQAMCLPDPLHGGDADADVLGHGGSGPMGRFVRRLGCGERHDLVDDGLPERQNTRSAFGLKW